MVDFKGRAITLLLIEDGEADQRLVARALQRAKIKADLYIVDTGEDGLAFLRGDGEHKGSPRPDLVLLDLNLPRIDGKQVLREIRADEKLKEIPVVMLTTSAEERDIIDSYRLGVNAYITKPVEVQDFMDSVQKLEEFWFDLVMLPSREN